MNANSPASQSLELCVIEGDGVGHDIIPAVLQVLKIVAPDVVVRPAVAGWEFFQQHRIPLPEATIEEALRCRAVLIGAIAAPPYPVEGYFSPVVSLRRALQTYANLRPTRYLPVPTSRLGVDLLVVRENTEDLYIGHEHTENEGRMGIAEKVITREATERVARLAYELASKTGRRKITIVHKANVLQQSDGLFRRVALEIAGYYPEIMTDELFVDTAAYWMVKDPSRFDVILTPNLYGDILSDMAAAWGGGLGLAPSVSVGDQVTMAEPIHSGSGETQGQANPTAALLSLAMLLEHQWGRGDAARRIEGAVQAALRDGDYTVDIYTDGALSTTDFIQRICACLQ